MKARKYAWTPTTIMAIERGLLKSNSEADFVNEIVVRNVLLDTGKLSYLFYHAILQETTHILTIDNSS